MRYFRCDRNLEVSGTSIPCQINRNHNYDDDRFTWSTALRAHFMTQISKNVCGLVMLLVEIEDRKTGVLKMIFLEDFHFFDKNTLLIY